MAIYAIGDLQGCYDPLRRLLDKLQFDPNQDQVWFAGDLVNRGKQSLETLRFVSSLGKSAITVLGNHDVSLICAFHGLRKPHRTLSELVAAPDYAELVAWLAQQPFLHIDERLGYAMSHAGISPQWDLATAQTCAQQLSAQLNSDNPLAWLKAVYGDEPDVWQDDLQGVARDRYSLNAFTRMRYCRLNGSLDFENKDSPQSLVKSDTVPKLIPWFLFPRKQALGVTTVFGHWSTLGYYHSSSAIALDTGCVWGGRLTAIQLDTNKPSAISITCNDYG